MPDTPVTFDDVELVRCAELGNWCRIAGREVFIGANVPLRGTTIRKNGDRGRLVIPRWFVESQDLGEPRSRR